jgi:hypothetical protein
MRFAQTCLGAIALTCVVGVARADDATHITGAPPDLVVQAKNPDGTWSTVCTGSCDRVLPTDTTYRVDGPGLRASKPFAIDGSANLTVKTGTWAGYAGGLTMVIVGLGVGVVGVGALALDLLVHAFCQSSCSDTLLAPGLIAWLGGAAVATGGLYVMRANARTTVGGATAVRLPAWREIPSPSAPRLGAVGIPLVSGTF